MNLSLHGSRLVGIAVIALAIPQLASASDSGSRRPAFKIAMG
jgi:hypothetical protein